MNANGEIAFSGMQLSRQGFSGAQVRQGFDATQAQTPQAVKTGYFDTSNVLRDAIKGKDENGNDVYLIPCPAGTTNVELQANWHYASEDEDLPDFATEADRVVAQPPPFVMASSCMDSVMLRRSLIVLNKEDFLGRFPPPVYYDEDGIANVLAMRKMIAAGYRFTMDTDVDNAFVVHLYDHVIMDSGCTNTTICNGELMHGLRHAEKELDMHTNVGSRVLDKEGFLGIFPPPVYHDEGGIANALAMREMIAAGYRITMDTDADNAFIVHCDGNRKMQSVNHKGVYVLEQLGANVKRQVKSTRPTPKKKYDDFFSPPEELYQHNRSITVCIDHTEIENAKFLTCIDTTVRYHSCIPVQNLKTDPVFEALDKIFRRYNKAGFQVKIIKCDRAFIPLTDDMLDNMGVIIDPTAAGDHEPIAEQNNRTLKERVRVALPRLPYKVVPKVITECLGRQAAKLLNVFPEKDSISSHFSPQQLIDNVNINYKSDMVAELGQYVHAIGTDSNNSMEPRSIEVIYIEPTKGQRTGHQVLNLNTKKMISRPKVVVLPRDLETFQDGDQIAGVDDTDQGYLEEAFDQEYEPENENERDFNLHGQFNDIDDSKREELLADADNDVDDMPELTVRFQGDDDYESDDNLGDEGDEEEEPIVANFDQHQENVDRGTHDIRSLVTDLEDLQEPPEEEIVFESEEPQVAKVTRSGQTYVQAIMSGLNLSQDPKKPREWPLSRSGSSANKNKNRVATRRKH
ncbi:unnamed protein product [Cylindrotheca closterium]|uniref:Integrase catalytic domain-containing protein n=1 Tax=Cylindrotheca closterium TaxID=2856 RepID=A0AAD2CCL0_9STRA|nr:unnamed protein product [Cylindrotheca closterium]